MLVEGCRLSARPGPRIRAAVNRLSSNGAMVVSMVNSPSPGA
jgi:hypothetical protein